MSAAAIRDQGDAWHPYMVETAIVTDLQTRVHVWQVGLDAVPAQIGDRLSNDERARADRFTRPQDRRRFIAARGALRAILTDCLDFDETSQGRPLRFRYGPAGKPFLVDDPALRFNVAHSEGLALIAVTRAGEVGVDVEKQRDLRDMGSIVRLVFNEAERAAMLGCPPAARETVFYRIWTHKEALLKAMGVGLASLKDPDAVSLAHASTAWRITTLPHLDGFAAALARPRGAHGLRLWSWAGADDVAESEAPAWHATAPSPSHPTTSSTEVRR